MSIPPEAQPDEAIVSRVLGGERDAFRLLVERYQDTLFRCALSMVRERDVAADMVQATLVHAYDRLGELRDPSSFGGWVYRTCLNRCRDHVKSKRRRTVPLDAPAALALTSSDRTDRRLNDGRLRAALHDALDTLNEAQRTAFVLKHVEQRSYEEMSIMLGDPIPALKMRVHRARETLRRTLEEVL